MAETKREEHERLQRKTDELKQEHADLSLDVTPFDQADHDRHTDNLRAHQEDLTVHKTRQDNTKT